MLTAVLYGNSLVLATIGARIERRTGFQPARHSTEAGNSNQRRLIVNLDCFPLVESPVVRVEKHLQSKLF